MGKYLVLFLKQVVYSTPRICVGPLLFVMFVNDIPSIVSSPTFLFADDIKIFHFVKSSDDHTALQNDLNSLNGWSVRWQLKFNISKFKHMHFEPSNI